MYLDYVHIDFESQLNLNTLLSGMTCDIYVLLTSTVPLCLRSNYKVNYISGMPVGSFYNYMCILINNNYNSPLTCPSTTKQKTFTSKRKIDCQLYFGSHEFWNALTYFFIYQCYYNGVYPHAKNLLTSHYHFTSFTFKGAKRGTVNQYYLVGYLPLLYLSLVLCYAVPCRYNIKSSCYYFLHVIVSMETNYWLKCRICLLLMAKLVKCVMCLLFDNYRHFCHLVSRIISSPLECKT